MFGGGPISGTADDLGALLGRVESATLPALWVGCGTGDALYADNETFVSACTAAGIPVTASFVPGEHDWDLWDQQIQEVLAWLPLSDATR